MHTGPLVFAQVMDHLPWKTLDRIVDCNDGDNSVCDFSCANPFLCMAFVPFS